MRSDSAAAVLPVQLVFYVAFDMYRLVHYECTGWYILAFEERI
jgi:hypothetical protein